MLCKIASRGPTAVPQMLSLHQRQPPNPMKQAYQASEIHLGHFSHSHGQGPSFHGHFITLVYLNPQLYCTMLIQGFSSSAPSLPSPPRTAAFWVPPPRLGGKQLLFNSKANLARVSSTCVRWPSGSKVERSKPCRQKCQRRGSEARTRELVKTSNFRCELHVSKTRLKALYMHMRQVRIELTTLGL